jgi:hypothetical protein
LILEIPNAIDIEQVNRIKDAVSPYTYAAPTTTLYRDGKTVNISNTPELKDIDVYLHEVFSQVQKEVLLQRYRPSWGSGDSGYGYHLYRPGDVCHYHSDNEFSTSVEDGPTMLRYASVILQLTTNKDGGELIFPAQNKKVKSEAGKIVIFPPYGMFGHYVSESSEPREVVVTWFVYKDLIVSKQNAA